MEREDIESDLLRRLYAYWQGKRAGRLLPARAALDPADFAYALANVALVDVLRDPPRFYFRVVGTEIARRDGTDLTGKYVDDHPLPEYRALLRQVYSDVVAAGRPTVFRRDRLMDDKPRQYEVLYLPLAADGASIDMLLVGIDFRPSRPAHQPARVAVASSPVERVK
ncbi:MAG TPA: PAS domain-containing protein [Stellaceae bacterium]|nr:PAS domain-containing protein [Stellaceae bacterium]